MSMFSEGAKSKIADVNAEWPVRDYSCAKSDRRRDERSNLYSQ
jgi:hypothetical protein